MSKADKGRALRFILKAEGWTGVSDPEDFDRIHDADTKLLVALISEVRVDERRRVGRELGAEANRIFNHQTIRDYPGNVLDRVNLHLVAGEPLEVRPEKYSRCRQQVKCGGCLDCLPPEESAPAPSVEGETK